MQSSINAGDTSQQVELQGIERVARLIAVTGPWLILALAVALPALLLPPFLTTTNITNVMLQAAIYVPLVVGMTYVITGGGIDLSVGSQVALCGVIMASMLQGEVLPLWLIIILTLALGALLGAINGIVISVLKIPDFVVTLAFMEIYRGLALVHSAGHIWYGFSDAFRCIGSGRLFGVVPMSLIIVAVVTVIAAWAHQRTYFGRYSIAIGGNREAAAMAGIKVWQLKVQQYGFFGGHVRPRRDPARRPARFGAGHDGHGLRTPRPQRRQGSPVELPCRCFCTNVNPFSRRGEHNALEGAVTLFIFPDRWSRGPSRGRCPPPGRRPRGAEHGRTTSYRPLYRRRVAARHRGIRRRCRCVSTAPLRRRGSRGARVG